jgi:DNA-binding transcriptional regulator YiaG
MVYMRVMKSWTGDQIKRFRKRLNMTQVEFAAMTGVSRVFINYLERGLRNPNKTMKLLLTCLEKQKRK